MRSKKFIILTKRDGDEEIVNKAFVKRVYVDSMSNYTTVVIHGSGQSPDVNLKVREPAGEVLALLTE